MLRVRSLLTGVGGAPWYTNHYFGAEGSDVNAQAAVDLVADFWNALDGLMRATIRIDVQGDVPEISAVSGEITAMFAATPAVQQGDNLANALPPADQALIVWTTDTFVSGRRLTGRTFVPGFCIDTTGATGELVAGAVTGLELAADALLGGNFGVWSRTHGVFSPATGSLIRTKMAVLRSRRD